MVRSIAHEKWHQTDLYLKPPLALGRVHLGISNPEQQPIFNEDESVLIMMYGEVFGYEEEKKRLESSGHIFKFDNDPEFCLHLYEECGDGFVQKLNGCFILIIFDVKRERILIANDRHGLLPFYYTQIDNRCVFASEVKAILKDETFNKEIDHEAVADFFAFGRIFGDNTFFKRVKAMPPASIITWSKGKISKKRYWDFKFEEEYDPDLTEAYYVKKLAALFRKAVERTTKERHRFGVFLSGGLDSRTIAAALDKKYYPINTFTYGIRGGDEAQIAKKIAEKLGTKHEFIELKSDYLVSFAQQGVYLTDGMLNCANFHWISIKPTVRKHADVMFHGLGLDILLSTVLSHTMYSHFYGGGSILLLERQMSEAKENLFSGLLYSYFNTLVTEEMMPLFFSDTYYQKIKKYPRQSFDRHLNLVREKDPVNKLDSFWLRTFGRYNLSRVILRNYSEDRVPSLDNDFFEFALKLPRKFRFRRQELYFKLLAELAPELAKIPYQRTGVAPTMPILAHRIGFLAKGSYKFLARKLRAKTHGFISLPHKIGYPDLDDWIRHDKNLRQFLESILLDRKTLARGYFNPDFVTQMVKDHVKGKKDWGMQLCALLTFELWNRLFIDESMEARIDYTR
jgi:asparagine synthase (glutamine-hydrolysing)